jgi:hypothetical protein
MSSPAVPSVAGEPLRDKNGAIVRLGARIRLLSLSGDWLDELSERERQDVLSMVGEIFEVEDIDEHGHPWVWKWWKDAAGEDSYCHSVALTSDEIVLVE